MKEVLKKEARRRVGFRELKERKKNGLSTATFSSSKTVLLNIKEGKLT